jgi:SAM-dependent methyltransferase
LLNTSYDRVPYPSAIFARTHPDRLATLALLHGLTPPDISTARVLEIGCGDGLNVLAMAAAYPKMTVEGFDLSEAAIARGNELLTLSGMTNASLTVLDAMAAVAHYPAGSFDYVIAHGVYAWVPDAVRAAIMELIGHVLSPNGVALISYNALPGGHMRMIMRDMLLHQIEGIDDPQLKIVATRHFLETLDTEIPADEPIRQAIRDLARSMLKRPDNLLFHDELGDYYAPQSLSGISTAAGKAGLRFLNDSGRNRLLDGFFPDDYELSDNPEHEIVRLRQADDYLAMRFFRQTVFVRSECAPCRKIATANLGPLWMTAQLPRREDGVFRFGEDEIEIGDAQLASALEKLTAKWPERLPVMETIEGEDRLLAVMELFAEGYVSLHSKPAPFAVEITEKPCASPLVRAQLQRGEVQLCALNHTYVAVEQPALRTLLEHADGTRTAGDISAIPDIDIPPHEVPLALASAALRALMIG